MVNQWLRIMVTQQAYSGAFLESLFHILGASLQRANTRVDIDSISLLSEMRYQLLDDQALQATFFKCLVQSADLWINSGLMAPIEQYWLLVKTIYAQDPLAYNRLVPVHILISLMAEIGQAFTSGTGALTSLSLIHI